MNAWLAAATALLLLAAAWTLASGSGWRRRLLFTISAPVVAIALWASVPDTSGWPTAQHGFPRQAGLISAVISEPDPMNGSRGAIYLWLDVGALRPRAYALAYSRPLHEQVQAALDRLKKGEPITVTHTHGVRARNATSKSVFRFYRHPFIRLPPKAHP